VHGCAFGYRLRYGVSGEDTLFRGYASTQIDEKHLQILTCLAECHNTFFSVLPFGLHGSVQLPFIRSIL